MRLAGKLMLGIFVLSICVTISVGTWMIQDAWSKAMAAYPVAWPMLMGAIGLAATSLVLLTLLTFERVLAYERIALDENLRRRAARCIERMFELTPKN